MDKNKPLPEHTKLDYYECYAKIVLESRFSTQFDLEISDKPDLQDESNGIGIEVTQGRNSKQQEIESLYTKLNYDKDSDPDKLKKQIERCGGKLEGGILSGISESDDFGYSIKAFQKKIAKINAGGYLPMKQYGLFIFDDCLDMTPEHSVIRNVASKMLECQESEKVKYQDVYICTPSIFWHLNFQEDYIKGYDISKQQVEWAMKAREMVEEKEII